MAKDKGRNSGDNKGGKGKDGKKDKDGKKGPSGRYGAYAGYKGASRKHASRMAQDEIRDVLNSIRRSLGQERRFTKNELQENRRDYRRTARDADFLFGESEEFMNQQNDILSGRFANADSQAQAAQAALMAQLEQTGAENLGGAADELERLGISGNFGDRAAADQAYNQDVASLMGAGNQATLDAMQQSSESIGDLLLGMNSGSKSNMLADAMRERNRSREDIEDAFRDVRADSRAQMRDTRAQKGAITRDILQQLAQLGWAQYVDQKNLNQNQQQINMQRAQMRHGFAMDRQGNAQQAAYSSTLANGLGTVYNGLGGRRPIGRPGAPRPPVTFQNGSTKPIPR